MNITEFLEARIADDEVDAARDSAEMERSTVSIQYDCDTQARFTPARVLAECAAKRALMELYEDEWELHIQLASVYSDHPDYQQEWAI
ncbi:DUF6221 family protein [Paenarthrobacter sp.]|uniref:DUF6221 family protein n=1 Tax=Paenarthrobacter sp. TaxID=1931993 RepID=UPI002810FCAB|nr:DUF6221 family protein [Paenarthrobacter sp.]